ncbi:MAG: hypothetical protein CL470_07970 [Acidimicrobiaceae bacterium]|nr:hypothetical protein [Acidimicrobiaceae bacterium]
MKLNDIDFNRLNDKELITLCLKYKLIESHEISKSTRKDLLNLIRKYLENKFKNYGQRNKDVKSVSVNRRMSVSGNIQKNSIQYSNRNGPPRPTITRRMSEPVTNIEKVQAIDTHKKMEVKENSQKEVTNEIQSLDPKYDLIGMYPAVKKLIAIGDLHGDLRVTIIALKLAEVIPQTSTEKNVQDIHWSGGSTWVIQLGDQIDRCRPDEWEKNCIKDYSDVYEDEGNNVTIIKLLLRLDDEARKHGGRFLGLLGNHEIMNVDKDFRYVSPKEFLEFVPLKDRNKKYTDDGYPMGYYHRTKAFERGSNMAKLYSIKKKSIITIGNMLFVHGGISRDLARKYTISEMNHVVGKWMCKQSSETEDSIFDEIFRDDDDMSPFWCRIYAEDDEDENTESSFNELLQIINQRNKLLAPIKGIVIAHTPQFMDNKYLNSIYNNRLWRIDVGMSRAFGKHSNCNEDKYRQIQILVIHDNSRFEIRKKPFNSERHPTEGIGNNVDLSKEIMY